MTQRDDVFVHFIHFPNGKTKEAVTENEDGTYTIFIDECLSNTARIEAYNHAIRHIDNNDFCEKDNVGLIEKRAHQK